MTFNLASAWEAIADHQPDRLALHCGGVSRTWREFDDRSAHLAGALAAAGVGAGDTIAMMMGNRRECFEVFQACAHLGVTYVPVNWHWVADELAYVLEDSAAAALIVDARFADIAATALADPRAARVACSILSSAWPALFALASGSVIIATPSRIATSTSDARKP